MPFAFLLTGVNEGVYDFRVRSVCNDSMYSAYTTNNGVLVFYPENHCINYVDLNSPTVSCFIGTAGDNNFAPVVSPIDDGPNSQSSRHTVYWTRNQYDPRTNYKLKTIPEGEFASVRLGNWQNGGEAERIEYKYTVDGVTAPILLLKYAVVFELPDHKKHLQPYFDLTIFDEQHNILGGNLLCGKAEFYAGFGDSDVWHEEKIGKTKISWKDWTVMGINLAGYEGQTLTIQLTTQDCVPQAHFGYAYFTLGCIDGTIESVSCGASEYMEIEAPEGFDYEWFTQYDNDGNPLDVMGNSRTYSVPASDHTPYHCRCSFKENTGCYFDLSTVVSPREPFADFKWSQEAHDCENWVRFTNKSHVTTIVDGNLVHTTESTQSAYWDFGDDEIVEVNNPLLCIKDEGDTLNVKLMVGISNDNCQDDTIIQVIVPSIITPVNTIDSVVCYDAGAIIWGNQYIAESGVYYDSLTNYAGCDSILILNAVIHPKIDAVHRYDTICFGESYTFGNLVLSESGFTKQTFTSSDNCDSVVNLNLTVLPDLRQNIEAAICKGQTYNENGFNGVDVTDTHVLPLSNNNGCDSTITLNLIVVDPNTTVYVERTIAVENLPFDFYGYVFGKNTAEGKYEIDVEVSVNEGCSGTVHLTLTVGNVGTGITDIKDNRSMNIIPNPVNTGESIVVRLQNTSSVIGTCTAYLYDNSGILISQFDFVGNEVVIDGFHVSGLYLVRIIDGVGNTYTGKVIVK